MPPTHEDVVARVLEEHVTMPILPPADHLRILQREFGALSAELPAALHAWCMRTGYQYLPREWMRRAIEGGYATGRNVAYFDPADGWGGYEARRAGTLGQYVASPDSTMRDTVLLVRHYGAPRAARFSRLRVGNWAWLMKLHSDERVRRH